MALEKFGIRLVAQDAEKATRQVEKFNKSIQNTQKTTKSGGLGSFFKSATAQSKNFLSSIKENIKSGNLFEGVLGNMTSGIGGMGSSLTSILPKLGAFSGGVLAAVAAVAALTAGMFKLGQRGAAVEQTQMAFSRVVGSIGSAQSILGQLRKQVRGTVSDVELMRLTITGLQGTSDVFRKEVLPNMGKVIDVTNRVAFATDKNADVIREKFITGLRLQSKLRLDDVGVAGDQEKANEAYAKSLGKTADQLTEVEEKAAFARDAISQLDRIGAEVGGEKGGLVSMQQASASVSNAMDTLGRASKPVFDFIAAGVAQAATAFMGFADIIAPIIFRVVTYIIQIIKVIISFGKIIAAILSPIITFGKTVGKWMIAALIVLFDVVIAVGRAIEGFLNYIAEAIQKILGKTNKDVEKSVDSFITGLAYNLAYGGAFVMGAFAAGILKGGTLVLQAVNVIAGIVADFLQGLSPPKKGPLSNIDKGGENVAIAWAEGFLGGIKQPVNEAASFVQRALGNISTFSREQVATALARLDMSIRPFVEQLEIAQSQMEAIAGFVDPAAKILERQRKQALQSLLRGDETDTSKIIGLDQQLVMLNKIKEAEQDRVDQAQLQLTIGQAQIAREKALLLIQQKRLGEADKETKEKETKLKGITETPLSEDGTPVEFGSTAPFSLGSKSISDAVTELKIALRTGSEAGLEASGFNSALAGFNEQTSEFTENMARIKESDPGERLKERIAGIPDKIKGSLDTLKENIKNKFNDIFGEGGPIQTAASNIGNTIISGINTAASTAGGVISSIGGFLDDNVLTPMTDWFGDLDLPSFTEISEFPMKLVNSLIPDDFVDLISGELALGALNFATFFTEKLDTFFRGASDLVWGAIIFLVSSPFKLLELGQKALDFAKTFIDGVVNFFSGESAITSAFDSLIKLFEDMLTGQWLVDLVMAGFNLGGAIAAGIVEGIIGAAQSVADAVTSIIPDTPNLNPFNNGGNQDVIFTNISDGTVEEWLRGDGKSGQSGQRWTGYGSPDMPKGIYHAMESVIPRFGMLAANAPIRIVPTPQGPMLQGIERFASMLTNRMVSQPEPMPLAGATTVNNNDNSQRNMNTTINVRDKQSAILMQRMQNARLNLA